MRLRWARAHSPGRTSAAPRHWSREGPESPALLAGQERPDREAQQPPEPGPAQWIESPRARHRSSPMAEQRLAGPPSRCSPCRARSLGRASSADWCSTISASASAAAATRMRRVSTSMAHRHVRGTATWSRCVGPGMDARCDARGIRARSRSLMPAGHHPKTPSQSPCCRSSVSRLGSCRLRGALARRRTRP